MGELIAFPAKAEIEDDGGEDLAEAIAIARGESPEEPTMRHYLSLYWALVGANDKIDTYLREEGDPRPEPRVAP